MPGADAIRDPLRKIGRKNSGRGNEEDFMKTRKGGGPLLPQMKKQVARKNPGKISVDFTKKTTVCATRKIIA